jgi:outer membrane protein, multidrug efflux system
MNQRFSSLSRRTVVLGLALALAACAPARLERPANLRADVPLQGLEVSTTGQWPAQDWWRHYGDPQLDQLVDMALKGSPDLAQAQSRVATAQQSVRIAAAQAGLRIDGSAQVARQRLSEHGLIPSQFLGFTWYNQADLGVQLQYDFDWWGKKRNTIDAALDQARAAQAEHAAAALALQSSVADTYFGFLADRQRALLAGELVANAERMERIAALRVKHGVDLPDTVQQARSQAASARQAKVAYEGSAAIRRAALATLAGVSPAELPALSDRALPAVDGSLPAGASVDLIARRPDIAASRWQVEAALKQTDVARAQFFPDFSLTAMAGLSSIDVDKVFTGGSRVFGLTPAVHLPIFEGGALQASYGYSKSQLDAAVAQYNATVIAAARDVATQALGARQVADRRVQQAEQVDAASRMVATSDARARQGVRDAREALAARAQLIQQRDGDLDLQGQALSADVALAKALGGGYRANTDTDTADTRTDTTSHGAAQP